MICIQLKIKCKTILLKTLENGLNKSYFMTYQTCLDKSEKYIRGPIKLARPMSIDNATHRKCLPSTINATNTIPQI